MSSVPSPLPPAVRFLLDRHQHADRPRQTQLIETHISWVVLTDRFAFKVKKPVRYSFLDFSTLAQRHDACREELRLNRRLAADTYLDVVSIVERPNGYLAFGGLGTVCEWAVKMRRLPESATLAHRLSQASVAAGVPAVTSAAAPSSSNGHPAAVPTGGLTASEVERIARVLTDFYASQPPLMLRPEQVQRQWLQHLRDNQTDLLAHLPGEQPRIQRIHAALLHYLENQSQLFESRICDGRFVEGHGDLRPEHVYLQERPVILDCVEFSAEFRRLDIADELSFLWMECDRLGQGASGERIWRECSQRMNDQPPASLLDFYKSYRACVRAKVYALQAQQAAPDERTALLELAADYLRLADDYQSRLGRGLLLVVLGLMGSGKSTLAEELANRLGARLVQTDAVRRQMFGFSPRDAGFNADHYAPERRAAVYQAVLDRAEELLAEGTTVILDGTFSQRAIRQQVRDVAAHTQADCVLVRCDCPRAVALERIERRRRVGTSLSEAREELYDSQARAWEADEPENGAIPGLAAGMPAGETLVVDTTLSLAAQREAVMKHLAARTAVPRPCPVPAAAAATVPW
jgi:aminoglycoside phosphotransferase family enzyme/predicted kinase